MTASVLLEYDVHEADICIETVLNPDTLNYVTGFGPGPVMSLWLNGHGGRYHYRTHFDWNADFPPWALEIYFDDPRKATLFKLRWG
jgi:hypothetical protein